MLTGGNDAVVKTWKLQDDRIDFKMKFVGHGSDITCVKFPRNVTTFLASTSLDKTARIWETVGNHIINTCIELENCAKNRTSRIGNRNRMSFGTRNNRFM